MDTRREIQEIYKEVEAQTDRGAAIIAAAILDDALSDALKSRLILTSNLSERIFSHEKNGALASFSSKIDMTAATGLLPKETCDTMHLIRRIRNKFAHSIEPLSFSDQEITAWILSMKGLPSEIEEERDPRKRYTAFTVTLAAALIMIKDLQGIKLTALKDAKPNPEHFMPNFTSIVRFLVAMPSKKPKS